PFQFQEGSLLFVGVHNEPLPVPTMSVSNENRSPFTIHGCDTAPRPACFTEIVGDYFPISHAEDSIFFVLSAQLFFGLLLFGAKSHDLDSPLITTRGNHNEDNCKLAKIFRK